MSKGSNERKAKGANEGGVGNHVCEYGQKGHNKDEVIRKGAKEDILITCLSEGQLCGLWSSRRSGRLE